MATDNPDENQPIGVFHDAATGEEVVRQLTVDEIAQLPYGDAPEA